MLDLHNDTRKEQEDLTKDHRRDRSVKFCFPGDFYKNFIFLKWKFDVHNLYFNVNFNGTITEHTSNKLIGWYCSVTDSMVNISDRDFSVLVYDTAKSRHYQKL